MVTKRKLIKSRCPELPVIHSAGAVAKFVKAEGLLQLGRLFQLQLHY